MISKSFVCLSENLCAPLGKNTKHLTTKAHEGKHKVSQR